MTCPCLRLTRPAGWHRRQGTKPCDAALVREREYEANRYQQTVPWTPGTPIVVPEFDPL